MDLGRDLFTITADKDRPSEQEMIAAIERRGFKTTVDRSTGRSAATGDAARPDGDSDAWPPLIQAALDRAKRDGKLVLVDFYADWCLPCKRMFQETYADPNVASEIEHFVFVKVDTDQHPEIAKRFGVAAIPDSRILGSDGSELARFIGFKSAEDLVPILRAALRASGVRR
jgi:thiol:disulfide interchange protein